MQEAMEFNQNTLQGGLSNNQNDKGRKSQANKPKKLDQNSKGNGSFVMPTSTMSAKSGGAGSAKDQTSD